MKTTTRLKLPMLVALGAGAVVAGFAIRTTDPVTEPDPPTTEVVPRVERAQQRSRPKAVRSEKPSRMKAAPRLPTDLAEDLPDRHPSRSSSSSEGDNATDPEESIHEERSDGPRRLSISEQRDVREDRKEIRERRQQERLQEFQAEWEAESEREIAMGSAEYDRMLYESGESNRVKVGWLTPDSAGGEAGLQPGDVVLRFDDVPIYNQGSIRWRSSLADPGEPIAVVFARDGEVYETTLVRDERPETMRSAVNGMIFKKEFVEP